MRKETIIYKDERGHFLTGKELLQSFLYLSEHGETDAETYRDYIKEWTGKNGSLIKIGIPKSSVKQYQVNCIPTRKLV